FGSVKDLNLGILTEYLKSRYVQILLVLTVIGALLRFYHLDFNSLWLDEASTLTMSRPSFIEIWNIGLSGDFHPPLFHWVEHVMLTFGQSEFVLRFVSAVMGTLTIPLMYLIGKEFRDRNVGIIAAALMTVSGFGIYYSQEAYSYAMVLFVFSLVLLFYLRAIRTDTVTDWILFGIFSALAFWTHYYVLIPLGVLYLHALITIRDRLATGIAGIKNIVLAFVTMTILIVPLIIIVVERYFTLTAEPPTYGVLGPILIPETFFRFSGFNWYLTGLYVLLMAAGFLYLFGKDRNKCLFSLMFLVLPLVASVLISARMTMNPRYLIYLLPVFFVMIALSYPLMHRVIPNKKLVYAFIAVIFVINAPVLGNYYTTFQKEDWRGFAGMIGTATNPGDIVVVAPAYISQPFTLGKRDIASFER
ncbi:glycosyltransferase family 39 protein, partial [Methanoregula sp.]|uniref:glycosyltransferase family 39 protein n=1 Tax=Methanoregula sp. TaxID=2052170 RepID=UPI000CCB2CAF